MGRRSKRTDAVPGLRLRKRGKTTYYFYDKGGKPRKEVSLGTDYGRAIMRWAELERDRTSNVEDVVTSAVTFEYVANQYLAKVVPTKGARTQRENVRELANLKSFFCKPPKPSAPLDDIDPVHVKMYLAKRSKAAPISANREKALLSHIWNFAREEGYTSKANPCAGVKGNKETGRDVYVEDEVFDAVYAEASQPLRDAMDLAYLVGQRVSDTLKMDERDLRDGFLRVRQNKTGAKRRIEVIDVRVERLQDISYEQAIAEGAIDAAPSVDHFQPGEEETGEETARRLRWPQRDFAILWDGLAKPGTRWYDNPWVWVVEFRRIEGGRT